MLERRSTAEESGRLDVRLRLSHRCDCCVCWGSGSRDGLSACGRGVLTRKGRFSPKPFLAAGHRDHLSRHVYWKRETLAFRSGLLDGLRRRPTATTIRGWLTAGSMDG